MTNNSRIKPYKKQYNDSYTIGPYPTIELLKNKPDAVHAIYIHSKYKADAVIESLRGDIPLVMDDKVFNRLGLPENSYLIGVFQKYQMELEKHQPHIVLVNPSDMGNLGTIIRTVLGFGYHNLAIITPAADMWNPKAIRASMGAVFKMKIQCFDSFHVYRERFHQHQIYPFMLGGDIKLSYETCPQRELFSLVFGNEASGLDDSYHSVGEAIQIPQTKEVDSLNLAVAVAIGSFIFSLKNSLNI